MRIYKSSQVDDGILKGKTIAVIGYGIQGAAQAQNLRDSGFRVVVGARPNGGSWNKAREDGLDTLDIPDAAEKGDVIMMLTPDMTQKEIYDKFIASKMKKGKVLYFSHGFNIFYKQVVPPEDVDVIMVAPKSPGAKVREMYLKEFGVPALFAVHQNASGKAQEYALALAKGMGCTRAGVFESTFKEETESDLFGEQAVLCGGSVELIKAGFETLVSKGVAPEVAYFEVLHELKLIIDLVQEGGLEYMWGRVSETARYGGRTRGKRVVDERVKKSMEGVWNEIADGTFAKEWIAECDGGKKIFEKMRTEESQHQIEKVGSEIRHEFFRKK